MVRRGGSRAIRRRASWRIRARAVFFKRSITGVERGAVEEREEMDTAGGAKGKIESGLEDGSEEVKKRRE